jgi:hypothetical protein
MESQAGVVATTDEEEKALIWIRQLGHGLLHVHLLFLSDTSNTD